MEEGNFFHIFENMNKLFIILIPALIACNQGSNDSQVDIPEEHYARFSFLGNEVEFSGKSDIKSEFYSHNSPDHHTPEKIRKNREENKNILTGRITDDQRERMVELFIQFPEDYVITRKSFKKLEGDSIWTLSSRKGNYSKELQKQTDKQSRFYFLDKTREYTSNIEPNEGFLYIERIHSQTDSTMTAIGNFEFQMRQFGESNTSKAKGTFNLEFYIGL